MSTTTSVPNVSYVRDEILAEVDKWTKIRDCVAGEKAVKAAKTKYLPKPNPEDPSKENDLRYDSYIERAVFYNASRRTLDGLIGQVFMRDPVVKVPASLEKILIDIDGAGVSLFQQSKKCLSHVMSYGRTGLLTDYPTTVAPITAAEQEEGYIRPTITIYEPWNILNWRTTVVGARKLLSLVVLAETYIKDDDGFEAELATQWRVLRLIGGKVYVVEIWKEDSATPESSVIPLDSSGKPFKEIPFTFVGAMNNDPDVDPAPLYDLATINIAHYRNSADYEESSFLVGQPTPYFAGLTEQWVKDVLKGKVMLGSRAAIALPEGGSAGLLQAKENSLPKEAMDTKERQMVALGAKLVEQREVQRTLGEAQIENSAETSILSTAAKNVSSAYGVALKWCSMFVGSGEEEIEFALNTDFPAARMTPDERAQLVAEWQAGGINFKEYRDQLRKAGVATEDDEQVRADNEKDKMRLEQAKISAEAKTMGGKNPGNSKTGGAENGRASPSQNGKTQ